MIKKQLRKKPEVAALFSNTITLTSVSNPAIVQNAIPNKTTALLDCRLLPGTDVTTFIINLKKKLKNPNLTIETVFEAPDGGSSDKNIWCIKCLNNLSSHILEKTVKYFHFFCPT